MTTGILRKIDQKQKRVSGPKTYLCLKKIQL